MREEARNGYNIMITRARVDGAMPCFIPVMVALLRTFLDEAVRGTLLQTNAKNHIQSRISLRAKILK